MTLSSPASPRPYTDEEVERLALCAAIQLGKKIRGEDYDSVPVHELANFLRDAFKHEGDRRPAATFGTVSFVSHALRNAGLITGEKTISQLAVHAMDVVRNIEKSKRTNMLERQQAFCLALSETISSYCYNRFFESKPMF
jgi:hypothetical protein